MYTKEEFVKFLEKNNVNTGVIKKFTELPECFVRNGDKYTLYINSVWYNTGDTFYKFEINYYCIDKIEFLFSSKVFRNVETSINNMIYELENINIMNCK